MVFITPQKELTKSNIKTRTGYVSFLKSSSASEGELIRIN